MDTIKASELPRKAADILQTVRTGGTVTITHYGKPIAQIIPYKEAPMNTYASRTDAIDAEIIAPIEASGDATADEYDIDAIADAVLGDHETGYALTVDPDAFWGIVADNARPTKPTITAADIRDLAKAEFSDLAVLAIDTDGDLWICPQSTAHEHGARIITDANAVESYTGGIQDEHTNELYAAFAAELNNDPSL